MAKIASAVLFVTIALQTLAVSGTSSVQTSVGTLSVRVDIQQMDERNSAQLVIADSSGHELKRVVFFLYGDRQYPVVLKFKVVKFQKLQDPIIVAVATTPGGSDTWYEVALIGIDNGKVIELLPIHLEANYLDALCLLDNPKFAKQGFVFLHFEGYEAHYAPHLYMVRYYELSQVRLQLLSATETHHRYDSWRGAAKELHYALQGNLLEEIAPDYR